MSLRPVPALLLLALAACNGGPASGDTLTRQRFVAANVALRAVPDSVPAADSLQMAALKKTGTTAPQLRAWIRANTSRPELMAEVWKEIADSLQRRDSAAIAARGGKAVPPSGASDTLRPTLLPEAGAPPPPVAAQQPIRIDPRRVRTKAAPSGQLPDSNYTIAPSP